MKFYLHNLGDWLPATIDLSAAQEGIYRRLVDWYYSNELPLPLSMRDIHAIARCRNAGEREAARVIVTRYFEVRPDGWHQERIDDVLTRGAVSDGKRIDKRAAMAERQKLSRERRDAKWAAVMSMGIAAPLSATIAQLDEVLRNQGVTQVVTGTLVCDVSGDDLGSASGDSGARLPLTINQNTEGTRDRAPSARAPASGVVVIEPAEPTRRQAAVAALKKGGFPLAEANTSDPRFLALLAAGATDDQLRLAAAEAVVRGKPWGWVVAVIAGRLQDIQAGYGPGRAGNGRFRGDPDRVAGLTPTIAKRAQQ